MSVVRIDPRRDANPLLVAALEELLQKARDGELYSGAFVCAEPTGDVVYNFVPGYRLQLVGGMEALKQLILQEFEVVE